MKSKLTPEAADALAQRLEQRRLAKTNLIYLANQVLGYNFQEDVHQDLFDSFPQIKEGVPLEELDTRKDRLVLWPRGSFKSSALVILAVQLILNYPDISILLLGPTVKQTRAFLAEIRSHFNNSNPRSRLTEIFPEIAAIGKKYGNADSFIVPTRTRVSKTPTLLVLSNKMAKAGWHCNVLLADDTQNDSNWRNPQLLERLWEDWNLAAALLDPGGYRVAVGTRYAFGDLWERIINQSAGNWIVSIRTCWKDAAKRIPLFSQRKLTDGRTIGFTPEMLDIIAKNDPRVFASQYLNSPIADVDQRFSEEMFLGAVKAAADFPALSPKVFFVDLAASRKNEADHSVVIVTQVDSSGRIYVTDCRGDHYSPLQLANAIIEMALIHRPIRIMIEGTASATYFLPYLQTLARDKGVVLPVETLKIDNRADAKFLRISAVEGFLRNQRLFFTANLPHWQELVQEAAQFPKGRHDDYLDCVSLSCAYLPQNFPQRAAVIASRHPMLDMIMRQPSPVKTPLDGIQPTDFIGSLGSDFE